MTKVVHNRAMIGNQPNQPEVRKSGRGGARPGGGRPKGSLDKGNAALREMILGALSAKGGQEYLEGIASSHPQAFVSLLGKVLPTTLDGQVSHTINWPVGVPKIES